MKTKYIIHTILVLVFANSLVQAQSDFQKEADALFNNFAYAKAIPAYENLSNSGDNKIHAYKRLAECYLLLRDFEKAIPYFELFIDEPETESTYFFKYAMALKSAGEEDAALTWFKRYKKLNKNDARLNKFLKDGNLASVVFNSDERFELEPVAFNSEYSEFGTFSYEGNLYFSSSRMTENDKELYGWNNEAWLDIYYIPVENDKSVAPKKLKGDVNSKFHESSLVFSTDYKNDTIIYFTRNNYFENKESFYTKKVDKKIENLSNLKIYQAQKSNGSWNVTKNLKINADYYSTGHPSVNPNRTLLFFASDRSGGHGGTDIYYCRIHPRGGLGEPINAGPIINTAGNEMFPFVNSEGQLFFSSDGHVGFGQLDVFSAVADADGEIIEVVNLGRPLNSEKDDFAFYSLPNGVDGYVSSNRNGGKGSDDIYKFKFIPSLTVEGKVTDAINHKPLDSVLISLYDQQTSKLVMETITDANGHYKMMIDREKNYMIEAVSRTHPNKNVFFSTRGIPRVTKLINQDFEMEPVMDVKLLANLNKIYFDFNKSNIRPDAAKELNKVIKLMTETYPDLVIRLEAHTDPVGSHAYNDNLSERRAKSTYEYLISHGVPKERILSYKGFGKRRLINDCTGLRDCTKDELELNRRTEFPIIKFTNDNDATLVKSN